ncbi:tetratricopeptide repeat protein [Laspinema sp. D1]|uniref:Tetratricopeptide repeat protein n=1 Tax=Laspinema palackyanum D2a TaxID=2953684 RepID=A0ABT2MP33_9CYAN|nr:tetratricopeptide repeat protein [Laspinema sp. D2a]
MSKQAVRPEMPPAMDLAPLTALCARIAGQSTLVLVTLLLSVGAATAQRPTPPPPPRPLVPVEQTPASSTPEATNPAPSADPSPPAETTPAATAENEPENAPESEAAQQEVLQQSSELDPAIQEQIQSEVDRAFMRTMSPLAAAIAGLVVLPVAATLGGIWLLRKSVANQVASEVREQFGQPSVSQLPASPQGGSLVKSEKGGMPLALSEEPKNTAQLNELISMALATQNLISEARTTLEESMKMQTRMEEPFQEIFGIYVTQGNELFREGRYENAVEMYDKATEINPECYEAFLGQGVAYTRLERYDEAIAAYNKAIRTSSDKADAWYGKARCYALKSDTDMAVDNLRQAISLNSEIREMAQHESDFNSVRETELFDNLMRS